eukprot:TRINITY_DN10652_c0_g1_i1.p1 TRINITY_DN10652_c0_g1~~TRINITY_DN10652_c0_g1_i1.p1  ORF type:complete len:128 (-),score=45.77 TRINITY_DN10652_c0_g1_i1:114-452(-)
MAPELTADQKDELAVTYASLLLHDDGIEVTADKINSILAAANVKVQPFWPGLFAGALAKVDVNAVIASAGSVGAPAAAGGSADAGPAAVEAAPEPEEEEESEEEEMGFGLFD